VDSIGSGGPEPMFLEYKSVESLMNNMIQGIVMGEGGSAADLVATAAAELEEFK
jgi:multiple sugar transport system substrate-binding protein